ncbi:MAG: carbon starvation protein A [Vicinamibacterales bacterium]|jgi:carbon starvation protein|nr:carbon starvation protein A [Vicinamibacterales bacterium]MDP6610191.1 carbon starvation protein A [Vicinamibacterales bacterium]HAK56593.1 carbon starvation protein A [Acidobacteriota bacterium]|tara:strand:+ start:2117 stop:3820 length:1704 start_codon:yes stop_codon:yes gene_type:complete
MPAILLATIGLTLLFLGYRFYSRFIAERIYRLDPEFQTPAHAMRDDIDYVPTPRFVLWGHHFTAVAGVAPIIGPAIAVIWGWLPAFLWVTIGTIFFAGVHDFGAVWASVRNRAQSIGALTGDVVGPRARSLFMIVIFLLLLMVNAVFGVVIADALQATPSSVIPVWAATIVALALGQLLFRMKVPLLWPTVIGTVILYAVIWVGEVTPIELPASLFGLGPGAQWILILFAYAAIASLLPIWILLQPRAYINGVQLFVGLGLMYATLFIARPEIVAPAFNAEVPAAAPPLMPLLFVTIGCGAVSGFHGLVGSGTTSKQLDREPDARFVGYLGSAGEGALALAAIIAATAGFASLEEWRAVYTEFGGGGLAAFVEGGATIVSDGSGLRHETAATLLTMMAVLFAGTTMDTGVRLQRYIVQEWGAIYRIAVLRNAYVATFTAVGACLILAFGAGGTDLTGGMVLWPLFGTTNQLLAGLTLLVVSVILVKLGRPARYTLVPMAFVTTVALLAALYQLWDLYRTSQYLLLVLDILIVIAAVFVMLEAASALTRHRDHGGRGGNDPDAPAPTA